MNLSMNLIENTLQNLNHRYATKQFDPTKKLTSDELNLIKESLRLSPSSLGLQPWKFLHIKTPELRAKIRTIGFNQPQITDASDLFIITVKTTLDSLQIDHYLELIAKTRNQKLEDLAVFKQMIHETVTPKSDSELINWLSRQVYIPIGFALAIAAEHQIDACPMEGFDSEALDQLLNLPSKNLKSKAILTFGFRSETDKYATQPKVRFPSSEVFLEF